MNQMKFTDASQEIIFLTSQHFIICGLLVWGILNITQLLFKIIQSYCWHF